MVVLSAAVTTKAGKALVARQYVDMSRIRIEGLLAAFPKLVGTGHHKQHTFIETESVRYVYQNVDTLLLLLVTNKASNIVEDLETLRILSKVVPDVAGGVTEDKVCSSAFELVFAFDEVLSVGGHREAIDLRQIRANLEMDSHEERLHKMVQETKLEAAKDEAARRARELKERQRMMQASGMSMGGMGGGGMGGGGYGGEMGYGGGVLPSAASIPAPAAPVVAAPVQSNRVVAKGMKLGGGGGGGGGKKNMLDALMAEDKLAPLPTPHAGSAAAPAAALEAAAAVTASMHPVSVTIEEKLSANLTREGTLEQVDLKGTLSLTSNREDATKVNLGLAMGENAAFSFQTHPKVNKPLYEQSKIIGLKDASKGFPLGRAVGVLRWSASGADESMLPLTVNCWPEEEGGGVMNVNIEYTLLRPMELHDVRIVIPLGTSEMPHIQSIDGSHRHDPSTGHLTWVMDMIDQSNSSGSLEFNVKSHDADAFFPINIQFQSMQLYADIKVLGVSSSEANTPVQYGLTSSLFTDSYVCS